MQMLLKPSEWPITIKVPLLVMALMLGISLVVSNTVLSRLADTQERQLQTLSRAYLDGLSANLLPYILHEDVWDVFDALDRARSAYPGLNALNTIVLNASDRVIAASDPKSFPTSRPVAPEVLQGLDRDGTIHINESKRTARLLSAVNIQGQRVGSIYAQLDVSALLAERQTVLWQLVLTNAVITLILTAIGYWAVRRLVKPVRTLGAYLDRGSDGRWKSSPMRSSARRRANSSGFSAATMPWRVPPTNALSWQTSLPKRSGLRAWGGSLPAWRMRSTIRWAACSTRWIR